MEKPATESGSFDGLGDFLAYLGQVVLEVLAFVIIVWLLIKLTRVLYEIFNARKLVYMRVTLPRADSKLDKERETKKDFKEKVGIMSVFYKSVHKIGDINFWDTFINLVFDSAKVSLELVYDEGQLHFYAVTFPAYARLFAQHATSNYPDAEVRIIKKSEYPNLKPAGYTLRTASIFKNNDDVYPIKTYKYFEDDPLSSFTNAFGSLSRTDKAVCQFIVKPRGSGWNRKAKNAASLVSKGQYDKGIKGSLVMVIIQKILEPLYWIANTFVNNDSSQSNAPGASSGDAYKIFNQAEQESQKAMGESAGQPGYEGSITILVASDTPASAENALQTVIGALNVFTDEYNNKFDNPQIEDIFSFILTPVRYFAFRFRLLAFLQAKSVFSTDELSTIYHFPDINYNKSPIIKWLDYKMLAPPHNLKQPVEPTMLIDYKRDKDGNIFTEDGSLLAVDKNKNLKRDENKNLALIDGTLVSVHQDGDDKGKPIDEGKMPIQEEQQRYLGGFPVYKDGVVMGWNEYRNTKKPIYFMRKDRGRHHYIIGKSG